MPPLSAGIVQILLVFGAAADDSNTAQTLMASAPSVVSPQHVSSVDDGIALLERQPMSAILLDLSMPDARDPHVIARFRRVAPQAAIMLLARSCDQPLARRAVQSGATDYMVTNELDPRTFWQLIAMMFERRGLKQQEFVERKRAEIALNATSDAVLTTDALGNITYLSPEAEALTGWTRAEAFARPAKAVFSVIDGVTRLAAEDALHLAVVDGRRVRIEGHRVLLARHGIETEIDYSASPLQDSQGETQGVVVIFRDALISRERGLQMLHQAEHDLLTGLPNRLLLRDRLARALAMARRHNRRAAVLFIDCDRFKQINDTFGHTVGDQALQSIAKRLTSSVRASDTVSRHGGDEFLILLSEIDHVDDPRIIADKIVTAVGQPHDIAGHQLQLTVSVGIGVFPDDAEDAHSLIERADVAMFGAKSRGRVA